MMEWRATETSPPPQKLKKCFFAAVVVLISLSPSPKRPPKKKTKIREALFVVFVAMWKIFPAFGTESTALSRAVGNGDAVKSRNGENKKLKFSSRKKLSGLLHSFFMAE